MPTNSLHKLHMAHYQVHQLQLQNRFNKSIRTKKQEIHLPWVDFCTTWSLIPSGIPDPGVPDPPAKKPCKKLGVRPKVGGSGSPDPLWLRPCIWGLYSSGVQWQKPLVWSVQRQSPLKLTNFQQMRSKFCTIYIKYGKIFKPLVSKLI